jgi:SET domain-containing protein
MIRAKGLVRLGNTKHKGKGVFAKIDIKKGTAILEFAGKVVDRKWLEEKNSLRIENHSMQIGPNKFFGPSKKIDDYINHSCNPNCYVEIKGRRVMLVSLRNLKQGEELNWDYSTTIWHDGWTMRCHCGSKNCRHIIGNFSYLPEKTKKKYIRLGMVPKYAQRP